ncbi:MAG: CDP-alcohol phosphatidyltransferase family protein [Fidelibacterota bacterium]
MHELKPTLTNIKKVVLKPYEPEPYARYIIRHLSVLFTWIFVRTPISANHVTLMQEIIGVSGCILIGFADPFYPIIGVFLLQLGYILDCSDGEVARWKNQQSINGVFLDLVGHLIVIPGYMFALGFGVWMRSGHTEALIAGFIAALFGLRLEKHTLSAVVESLITETEKPQYDFTYLSQRVNQLDGYINWGSSGSIGRRSFIQILFRYPDSMNIITITVLLDYLLTGISINGTMYSISYIIIMTYGIVLFFGRLIQIYRLFKNNLVEKRFLQILKIARNISK